MPILHIDLRPTSDTHATLRYGWENLNRYNPRNLALAEIQDLIALMERDYYGLLPENFVITGQRLYRWLDGSDRWLERTLRERRAPLVALAIAATGQLAHLPWEVLHDGNEFLVAKKRPTVVPLRWCDPTPENPRPLTEATDPPPNRALNLLFMATAPEEVQPELRFEEEEARILEATAKQPLRLQVEESGCLAELADLYGNQPTDHAFDAVHLTGHAAHSDTGPIFLTETEIGNRHDATAADLADVFGYRWPRLLWLSGCRTGERMRRGDVPSLAEALIAEGAEAVLGWGRPVLDTDGTAAAAALYGELAAGKPLLEALARTLQTLLQDQARDWHLLRLYVTDTLPGALVTPRGQRLGQANLPKESAYEFLDPETRTIKVPTRDSFVGRRRPLQQCLRGLRDPSTDQLGVVITGMGGYGKSSLAARICDRLPEFDRRVWIGPVDEPALTNQLADWLDDPALRQLVTDDQEALKYRLRKVFRALAAAPYPARPLLLVLDDFEQNLEADCATLKPAAADCLDALLSAIAEAPAPHRLLITCRYEFAFSQGSRLLHQPLAKFKPGDWQKKCAQLAAFQPGSAVPSAQRQRALTLADGNPRLVEWLDKVLRGEVAVRSQPSVAGSGPSGTDSVDVAAVLDALEQNPTELREQVLAATLLAQMAAPLRDLLQRGRVFELPVPLVALREISAEVSDRDTHIAKALALGLLETDQPDPDPTQPHLPVRVPRVLPLEPVTDEALAAQAAQVLYRLWLQEAENTIEAQKLQLYDLAIQGGAVNIAKEVAESILPSMIQSYRFKQARLLAENFLALEEDYQILRLLGTAQEGEGKTEAVDTFTKVVRLCPPEDQETLKTTFFRLIFLLLKQGPLDNKEIVEDLLHKHFHVTFNSLFPKVTSSKDVATAIAMTINIRLQAMVYKRLEKIDEAISLMEMALPLYDRLIELLGYDVDNNSGSNNFCNDKAMVLSELGILYTQKNDEIKTREVYFQAIPLFINGGNLLFLAGLYQALSESFMRTDSQEEAKIYMKKSIETILESNARLTDQGKQILLKAQQFLASQEC